MAGSGRDAGQGVEGTRGRANSWSGSAPGHRPGPPLERARERSWRRARKNSNARQRKSPKDDLLGKGQRCGDRSPLGRSVGEPKRDSEAQTDGDTERRGERKTLRGPSVRGLPSVCRSQRL